MTDSRMFASDLNDAAGGDPNRRGDAAITEVSPVSIAIARHWPLLVALVVCELGFQILAWLPATRVGDGSEYFVMFLAWRDTFRPFVTEAVWRAYLELFNTHTIAALVSVSDLRSAFPALVLGATADLNHFWLYSLPPALLARAFAVVGIELSPQGAFLTFHWLLVSLTLSVAWQGFRVRGLLAAAMLVIASPIVWYLDKVHTETFTVCLTTCAVILFLRRRFLWAAFFLALASTQNISFLAVAGTVLILDVFTRGRKPSYTAREAILAVVTVVAMFLHPVYYFFRFGVITPQLLAGGASIGANLRGFYIWFLDPDLGLLTNWPLGLLALLCAIPLSRRKLKTDHDAPATRVASRMEWTLFALAYLVVNLFAQSSTINLNSGATPGLARYGLWYVALFFPLFVHFFGWAAVGFGASHAAGVRMRAFHWRTMAAALICVSGVVYAYALFRPTIKEDGSDWGALNPSWLSSLIQTRFSFLYDPPVDVFHARYVGPDERTLQSQARAIVGPDCRKVLVQPGQSERVLGGQGCAFSPARLIGVLQQRPDAAVSAPTYLRLTEAEFRLAQVPLERGVWHRIGIGAQGDAVLGLGWGLLEPWGVWSSTAQPALGIPCEAGTGVAEARTLQLAVKGFVVEAHESVELRFSVDDAPVTSLHYRLGDPQEVIVTLPLAPEACRNGVIRIVADIDQPVTPVALHLSADARLLGMALTRFRID